MPDPDASTEATGGNSGIRRELPPALTALDAEPLGPYTLRVTNVVSRGYVEQVNFDLVLTDPGGHQATPPVFSGTYSSGRPAAGVVGWVDGVYADRVCFPDGRQVDLQAIGLDR
ncbi:MAG: hypothetical protein D6791_09335, partial [Chloroflexi bacterium]